MSSQTASASTHTRFNPPTLQRPFMRRVFDIDGTLALNRPNTPVESVVIETRKIFLDWLRKGGAYVTQEGFTGQDFISHPHHGYKHAIGIALEGQWAVQFIDDDKEVPERKWMTEFYLDYRSFPIRCCVRQTVSQPQASYFSLPERTVPRLPRFVRKLCDEIGLYDSSHGFLPEPWEIEGGSNFEEFFRFLIDPVRTRPILVITRDSQSQRILLNAGSLARQLLCIAHVAILDSESTWEIDHRLGRDFTVYDGAVRTYRSGFSIKDDEPYQHPLILSRKIQNWEGGAKQLEEFLAYHLSKDCSLSLTKSGRLYSFSDFRNQQLLPQQEVKKAIPGDFITGQSERLQLLESQITTLEGERDLLMQSAMEIEGERNQALKEMEALKADNLALLENIRSLSSENQRLTSPSSGLSETYPDTLDKLREWAGKCLGGKLHFVQRAYRGAKDSYYHNVNLVYCALDFLANEYRQMRLSPSCESKKLYEDKLSSLGLENTATFASEATANEGGDTYKIDWQGKRRLLSQHLKKGKSRDPKHCLRIYYFWCNETEQVIVGWLTSHLENRQT